MQLGSTPHRAFEKWEGTANDFVVVFAGGSELDPADADYAVAIETVRAVCDRHRGVGADGILLVTPPRRSEAEARMIVLNADGSRPEMCGNGVRCVALALARQRRLVGRTIVIETDAGLRACETSGAAVDADHGEVTVAMGQVRVEGHREVEHAGRAYSLIAANAGNPHAISFEALDDATLDALGAALQRSVTFPDGVNLERVRIEQGRDGAVVDVFERGVGRTFACGTGACAVATVMVHRGLASAGRPIPVTLTGGALDITVERDADAYAVRMRGPARRAFAGELSTPIDVERRAADGARILDRGAR